MSRDISKSIESKLSPLNCPYSMEQELYTIQMWKDGDWNFDDYESDYGEYNEVIDDVEEEVFADTQLSLEGVF